MDFSGSFDAYVSRLPGLTLLATPSNSDSPAPPRLPSPPRSPDPSPRPSPGPSRISRRGGAPPYICTDSCQMIHRHIYPRSSRCTRRRSSSRASIYRTSRPSSPRRGSARRPPLRPTAPRRPPFPNFHAPRMSPPLRPLFSSRLVVVTIIDNVVADVASFSS